MDPALECDLYKQEYGIGKIIFFHVLLSVGKSPWLGVGGHVHFSLSVFGHPSSLAGPMEILYLLP